MATLHIRGLKDSVKESLRVRAAQNGRSMEAEARAILEEAATGREPVEHPYLHDSPRGRQVWSAGAGASAA